MGKTGTHEQFTLHDEHDDTSAADSSNDEAQTGDEKPQTEGTTGSDDSEQQKPSAEPETLEQITADRDKWKAMARKHEDRAKQNAAAAQEWAKQQETAESTAKNADEATQQITAERDTALAELAVLRAAVKHNLSEDDLELLEGLPADVVEQRAAKLAARVQPRSPRTPDPHLGRETPPIQQPAGDFLSTAFKRR